MQTKIGSLFESITNLAVGYLISLILQVTVLPLYGVNLPLSSSATIVGIFTIASLIRTYILRRVFNRLKIFNLRNYK
jgi:hypothetical protein